MIDRHTETAENIGRETGARLDEIADDNGWAGVAIGPVGQHRDSQALDRSNFTVITEDLQTRYPDETEILRFGHWAVGWVEEIAYNAGNADLRAAVQAWRDKLDNYPVADEEHFSELEHGELMDYLSEAIPADLPAGVTAGDVTEIIMENGDVSCSDDVSDDYIRVAIEEAVSRAAIKAATPPTSQLQLVTEHGRPHCSTPDAIEAAVSAATEDLC